MNRPCRTSQSNFLHHKKLVARTVLFAAFLVFFLPPSASAQDTPQEVKQFIAGSIADKTRVLSQIDMTQNLSERTRQLPRDAIGFVLAYRAELGSTSELDNLFFTALGKLQAPQDIELLTELLDVFTEGKNALAVITRLYEFAQTQSARMKSSVHGINVFLQNAADALPQNAEIVRAAVKTLALCGDSSSFQTLFPLARQTRDAETVVLAQDALEAIKDGMEHNALQVISEGALNEKLFMLNLILARENFSVEFKGKSAETALSQAIIIIENSGTVSADGIALLSQSLAAIVRYDWTRGSHLVLSLFPAARRTYEAGAISEALFIQAIAANGSLGVSGAGRVLSDYLAVLNTITENAAGDPAAERVNAAVVLALINTLGTLGDKTAFDNLLYVTYLDYDNVVIQSAREALAKLKW
jgi:hypothetical protein